MKKSTRVLLVSMVALSVGVAAAVGVLGYQFVNKGASQISTEVIYEVMPGKGFKSIAKELEQKGLISNSQLFTFYVRFKGSISHLKMGEYLLRTDMKPSEVLDVITSGKSITRPFTVAEGLSSFEIADLFEKAGYGNASDFLALVRDPAFAAKVLGEKQENLEGYLFPETYMLTKYTDAKTLISAMVRRFIITYEDVLPLASIKNWSRHQVATLASIVEKETGAPQERPIISSVFHNRLAKKMRLQTDPTVIYGKAEKTGKIEISITREDLLTPTRFNTYVIFGLPPGPISNPGKEALIAAVNPAKSNYLFFVSQNDGTHIFSEDYKAHQQAVKKFQLDPKAREGKSWRDLKRKDRQSR